MSLVKVQSALKYQKNFLFPFFLSVSSQGNGRKIFGTNQPSMMQTVWSFLTFLADALSNTMKMIQTFFTKVHTWKDTVHSNYTAILMRKEGENRHHFSYCCWCLIIIKSFQKENSHALVLHCQMQMLLSLLVKLSLFGRQKRACGSENHHFLQNTFQYQSKCLIWIFHLILPF